MTGPVDAIPHEQARSVTRGANVMLLAALAAWASVSIAEHNAAIFVAAFVPTMVALPFLRIVARGDRVVVPLFALAYLFRTLGALAAYLWGKGQAYWIGGVGSDAVAYYETSFLDAGEVLFGLFSFKGFVAYNSFVTRAASAFDQASYLCNLQGPLLAGTLLVALVYAVTRELTDRRTAVLVAAVMALHPTLVAISAVLLRDTVVGFLGWTFLYLVIRALRTHGAIRTLATLAAAAATLYLLSYLRLQSMLLFFAFGLVVVWFVSSADGDRSRLTPGMRRVLLVASVGVAAVVVGVTVAGTLSIGLGADYFRYVIEYRADNAAQGSLGASFASGNLAVSTGMYTLLALLAPFPFYAWSPEVLSHPTGPLDYLVGLGGILNQFLCAFFIIGVFTALRRRIAWLAAVVACVMGFIVLTTLGGGDTIRYVATHVYGFFLVVAVTGIHAVPPRRRTVAGLWVGGVVGLYTVYESLKMGAGRNLLLTAGIAMLLYVATFLIRAWQLAGPQSREARGAMPARRPIR